MRTIGLCTHFCEADSWAFDYALKLVKARAWQLNICHWLPSPYRLRRDLIPDDLFLPQEAVQKNPQLLARLELQLREYYDERLGDFINVAFKLCEGMYEIEMVRCFRQNLLDLVVMGYLPDDILEPDARPIEEFAVSVPYPLVIVGKNGPNSFLLNQKASEWLDILDLKEAKFQVLDSPLVQTHH